VRAGALCDAGGFETVRQRVQLLQVGFTPVDDQAFGLHRPFDPNHCFEIADDVVAHHGRLGTGQSDCNIADAKDGCGLCISSSLRLVEAVPASMATNARSKAKVTPTTENIAAATSLCLRRNSMGRNWWTINSKSTAPSAARPTNRNPTPRAGIGRPCRAA